ncbi:uracil-DNA glycosylase [Haematobacter missouriensis]|uniref:Type-4 uracil-DNA glycosylase n=1 Tax=Haematobacter missouriensis TaxID=366616 RepID=A0A212AL58_9RHOB|nr:uracil-DNA glycosylase [Haematobacter missouriensis]KFI29488.1 uracil-DNA glycosylase [Haematobacter missouriensis]OWJ80078.1 uracil-DNA glycosylase [Haematobacter missouriensis]OWJ82116.1 uracil-DNA glycosylase [Haematobacter missouriensis]
MLESLDHETALALLEWQIELGATEAIGEGPVDRFAESAAARAARAPAHSPTAPGAQPALQNRSATPPPEAESAGDPVAEARALAAAAPDLAALREAMAGYGHCELRKGARNLVFADGQPGARVMIVGEAPGREEDQRGLPFVGRAGRLLDLMFGAIGMGRAAPDAEKALYITNILPWRPPQNRDPSPEEIAMMLPFVERHVALADPDFLVLMGNISCQALLGRKGITRLRGTWQTVFGRPALPMFHPAFLLRNPPCKRESWSDLLLLQSRLEEK